MIAVIKVQDEQKFSLSGGFLDLKIYGVSAFVVLNHVLISFRHVANSNSRLNKPAFSPNGAFFGMKAGLELLCM